MSQQQGKDVDTIVSMLGYRRPTGSRSEKAFINRFLKPLGVKRDSHGNHFLKIGKSPKVLWSSHTDSVHHSAGSQDVTVEGNFVRLATGSDSSCLGADDAAGMWIMTEMIKASVPGLYVFHTNEERGCHGSRAILHKTPQFLNGIRSAIAFDRRGDASVITKQGGRCCSDQFGLSLARQLPARFKLDPTGVVTDTKIYMGVVPECTNVSVGYYDEHRPTESLDVVHLIDLRDYMLKIDSSKFVIARNPAGVEPPRWSMSMPTKPRHNNTFDALLQSLRRQREENAQSLYDYVHNHPDQLYDALVVMGITFDDIHHALSDFDEDEDDTPPLLRLTA